MTCRSLFKKNVQLVSLFFWILFLLKNALAISIDWSGGYRVEYNSVSRPSLSSPKQSKEYALNYLYLQPKIIGSDGINIHSRFDILTNQNPAYRNSQIGSLIGGGLNDGTGATGSNADSQNQNATSLLVSQLYLNVNDEFGSLLVGRTPIGFGLGITHNAGQNPFDHWIDTKEVISYRFVVDNLSFAPMISKVSQDDFGGGTISEQIFIFEYNNKDNGSKAGLFHQTRKGGQSFNDYSLNAFPDATSANGALNTQTINLFLERRWTSFEFKVEASFLTGSSGVQNSRNENIDLNSYAIVAEALLPAQDSPWEFESKFGVVSGDNPNTSQYEAYNLDRNYDLGILLFNHRLGSADILGTRFSRPRDGVNNLNTSNSADDESVSNTFFVAPSFKYKFNEKIDFKNTVVYAQLLTNSNNYVDFKKDLGLELDAEVIYRPRERVTWSTGLGILLPGSAWQGGDNKFDKDLSYALTTKAAITF